jgi:phosphopantothenoylcysteine decarboxylase/phosphopantothenate--cysteine ligase
MNVKMYESKVTQENIRRAKSYGWTVVEPDTGELACGYSGKGRLPSVEKIFGIITRNVNEPLKGKKFIVTAGSSIERIDPVRYISNFSSGKMGVEIAKYLYRMGADVLLVCGRVSVNLPEYIDTISVESTSEMLDVLEKKLKDFDGLYMAAAPVDFMPEEISKSKIKKADKLNIGLIKTPDILGRLKILYPDKFYVGFALETDDPFENAVSKLKNKGLDFIALNVVTDDFNPMGSDENSVTIISKDGIRKEIVKQKKDVVAAWIVNNTLGLCEK